MYGGYGPPYSDGRPPGGYSDSARNPPQDMGRGDYESFMRLNMHYPPQQPKWNESWKHEQLHFDHRPMERPQFDMNRAREDSWMSDRRFNHFPESDRRRDHRFEMEQPRLRSRSPPRFSNFGIEREWESGEGSRRDERRPFEYGIERAPEVLDQPFLDRIGAKVMPDGRLMNKEGFTLRTRDPHCDAPSPPLFNPGRERREREREERLAAAQMDPQILQKNAELQIAMMQNMNKRQEEEKRDDSRQEMIPRAPTPPGTLTAVDGEEASAQGRPALNLASAVAIAEAVAQPAGQPNTDGGSSGQGTPKKTRRGGKGRGGKRKASKIAQAMEKAAEGETPTEDSPTPEESPAKVGELKILKDCDFDDIHFYHLKKSAPEQRNPRTDSWVDPPPYSDENWTVAYFKNVEKFKNRVYSGPPPRGAFPPSREPMDSYPPPHGPPRGPGPPIRDFDGPYGGPPRPPFSRPPRYPSSWDLQSVRDEFEPFRRGFSPPREPIRNGILGNNPSDRGPPVWNGPVKNWAPEPSPQKVPKKTPEDEEDQARKRVLERLSRMTSSTSSSVDLEPSEAKGVQDQKTSGQDQPDSANPTTSTDPQAADKPWRIPKKPKAPLLEPEKKAEPSPSVVTSNRGVDTWRDSRYEPIISPQHETRSSQPYETFPRPRKEMSFFLQNDLPSVRPATLRGTVNESRPSGPPPAKQPSLSGRPVYPPSEDYRNPPSVPYRSAPGPHPMDPPYRPSEPMRPPRYPEERPRYPEDRYPPIDAYGPPRGIPPPRPYMDEPPLRRDPRDYRDFRDMPPEPMRRPSFFPPPRGY
ncbi:unnamed protein product [Caenorhabditis auriculariae]|uniref:Uncharacterized protein n=1 Tax=Caenorhabditis auriculariae TaxID=2777116 RepID=A0A8S1HG64_9PELO|nr:unnamed protein product [Caenorhabditis auriculariae]